MAEGISMRARDSAPANLVPTSRTEGIKRKYGTSHFAERGGVGRRPLAVNYLCVGRACGACVCWVSGICGELFNSGGIGIMAESAEKTAGPSVCQELRVRACVLVCVYVCVCGLKHWGTNRMEE